ncbi:glycosyltransferase family 32 protein [Marinobacter caseinilyticus]|uniref:glycosyltransferase family 32 protein n=1 Tax=Marinobacter caseinilyticus TaxID=2692195 RepID=UPI001409FE6A|nr:glycosyltransferase [Marinobacter caseinilyticus]
MSVIPKTLHFVWVGDESLRPDAFIETWRRKHPDFKIRVWGNDDWKNGNWLNRHHMDAFAEHSREFRGIADIMRWEILLNEGGFALDADSVCINRLPDWLFDCSLFAAWENEYVRPGLVANGYVGAHSGHAVIASMVNQLAEQKDLARRFVWYKLKHKRRRAWNTTGPIPFTNTIFSTSDRSATIVPSHFFLPVHHSGEQYKGDGPIYSCELFAGTKSSNYDSMYGSMIDSDPDLLVSNVRAQLGL